MKGDKGGPGTIGMKGKKVRTLNSLLVPVLLLHSCAYVGSTR